MRVLHIGRDFVALRPCGLTLYSEALMREQRAAGDDVAYFFAGRHYPGIARPRLHRWRSRDIAMYELLSTRVHAHWTRGTRLPLADLHEPEAEEAFGEVLREVRPAIVHVHELNGLPSAVLEQARAARASVVMTLHDYAPLCAAVRLVDADGGLCTRREVGEDCARNCAAAPEGDAHLVEATLRYELRRIRRAHPRLATFAASVRRPAIRVALEVLGGRAVPAGEVAEAPAAPPASYAAPPADYQRRRDVNVARLNGCDRLVAPSQRVADIYAGLGVDPDRLVVQRLSRPHLEHLSPPRGPEPGSPLTFVTLGGLGVATKGSQVLLAAVRLLDDAGYRGRYRLRALGDVAPAARAAAEQEPSIELAGGYLPRELPTAAEDGDVGLVPSVWEEVHGFVGVEMLALGMPLIGSALGGITEYVVDGETGWVNRSAAADELARLMMRLIDDPAEVERMRRSVLAHRDEHVRPLAPHVAEVAALYDELLAPARAAAEAR